MYYWIYYRKLLLEVTILMDFTQFILIIKFIVLGFVQGFTEPIPVSSSGHLIIAQKLLNVDQKGLSFELLTNTASLFAIMFIYRKDIIQLIAHSWTFLKTREQKFRADFMFVIYIIIGTIPAGLIGFLFKDEIESVFSSSLKTVAIALLVTGTALWLIRNFRGVKRTGDLTTKDAILVGLAQAVALIPGISRSGSTVISSIAVGMKQDTALRFSFMLYIPISLGGMILGFSDIASDPHMSTLALPYTIAFFTTLIVTYFAMKWFMGIMEKGNLIYFSYYCFAAGILLFLFGGKL